MGFEPISAIPLQDSILSGSADTWLYELFEPAEGFEPPFGFLLRFTKPAQ